MTLWSQDLWLPRKFLQPPDSSNGPGQTPAWWRTVAVLTKHHEVLRVIEVLRAVVVIDRPDAVVAIDEDVLRDEVVLLQDRRAAGAVLHRVRVAVTVAGVRQVRLTIPAIVGAMVAGLADHVED